MTLTTTASRITHAANGASTVFAFNFPIWAAANVKVYLRNTATLTDTVQTLNVDYTIDIATYPNTGNVVFTAAPPAGRTVIIVRDMPLTQDLDLIASGAFAAENVEQQLDKLAAEIQSLRELIARTPRLAVGTALADIALPEPRAAAANQLLGINPTGDGYDLKAAANLSLQTVSSYIATLLDDPDAATARATLGVGSTIDLNLLATDATGGVLNDLIPFVDVSDANASNKVTIELLFANAISGGTDLTAPESNQAAYQFLARKTDGSNIRRVTLNQLGVGKQTIWVPAGAMTPRTSNGAAPGTVETPGNKVMLKTLDFDPAAWEYAQFAVQMPKGWNEGSMSAVFVWSHAAAVTNFAVVWGIHAVAAGDGDNLDVAFGAAFTVTDTGGTANTLYRAPETTFSIAGPAAENDVVFVQIWRAGGDAADTLAVDARLHGVALLYTTTANTDS